MTELPAEFIERMKKILGVEFESFLQSYTRPPEKGIRVNLLKISTENFEKISPIALDGKVLWDDSGYYAKGESLGKTIAHAAGLYYVQEPSAMCAAPELEATATACLICVPPPAEREHGLPHICMAAECLF